MNIPQNTPFVNQVKPAAGTLDALALALEYQTFLQEFIVCNQGNASDFFRMALCAVPNNGILCNPTSEMYMYYDVEIPAKTTFTVNMNSMVVPRGTNILVQSENGDISFTLSMLR